MLVMKMPKTYTITAENTKELRKAMRDKSNSRFYAKLQSVALRGEGKGNEEIGSITGYHPSYVSQLVSVYCNEGLEGLCKDERKGGNNRNMTDDEEKAFLSGFEEAAKRGRLTTIAEISAAYDEVTGKKHESKSTVYYLLHKHGWRIITPQTAHPGKASEEAIEASKKLTLSSKR
jgi:transposase